MPHLPEQDRLPKLWTQSPLSFGWHFKEKVYLNQTSLAEQNANREASQRWHATWRAHYDNLISLPEDQLNQYIETYRLSLSDPQVFKRLENILTFPSEVQCAMIAGQLTQAEFAEDAEYQAALQRYTQYAQRTRNSTTE
jgi:hypothetical protein